MCIILDANIVNEVFVNPTKDGKPIVTWIYLQQGRVVIGGKLTKEITKNHKVRRSLAELKRASKLIECDNSAIKKEADKLSKSGHLKSDDPHVIALARISHSRRIFTRDKNLQKDFKDKRFIDIPRGKVYSQAAHVNLLSQKICKGPCGC